MSAASLRGGKIRQELHIFLGPPGDYVQSEALQDIISLGSILQCPSIEKHVVKKSKGEEHFCPGVNIASHV